MMEVVASNNVPYIMMHLRGTPQTMQNQTNYEHLINEMITYFSEKIYNARNLGINDLIIDPGFGFAKTTDQNFEILGNLELFKMLDLPILTGVSRKSMIYKTLDTNPDEALNGTTVLNTIAITKGANIIRVHDVKEAIECVKLYEKLG
jgi:dihydropteroate synthase